VIWSVTLIGLSTIRSVPAFAQLATEEFGRAHLGLELTGGLVLSTLSEPTGFGQARARGDVGGVGGIGIVFGGASRVSASVDLLGGRAGVGEFLGSRTIPVEYRFTFVDLDGVIRVGFGSPGRLGRGFFIGGGLGVSRRFNATDSFGERSVKRETITNTIAVLTGGIRFGRVLVEGRYAQDIGSFELSPLTTASGTKRFRASSILAGYRIW
jgi:hypothetical protein